MECLSTLGLIIKTVKGNMGIIVHSAHLIKDSSERHVCSALPIIIPSLYLEIVQTQRVLKAYHCLPDEINKRKTYRSHQNHCLMSVQSSRPSF